MRGYRKVICGDYATASRYFSKAEQLLREAERQGLKKKVHTEPGILIIAKWRGEIPEAVFIIFRPVVLIFLHSANAENVVSYYGWDGSRLFSVFTLDLKEYFDPVPGTLGSEIPPFVEKNSYVILRDPAPAVTAPHFQFPLSYFGTRTLRLAAGEAFSYAGTPFRWNELFRGSDRDFVYTASITGTDAEIHQRIWPNSQFSLLYDLPLQLSLDTINYPGVYIDWPATSFETFPPKAFNVIGNKVYVVGSHNSSLYTYNEIWEYDADLSTWTAKLVFDVFYAGGSSYRHFGGQLYNTIDDETAISLDEYADTGGLASDLQLLIDFTGTPIFSFSPGSIVGYSRTLSNETRISFAWKIAENLYGYQVQNTAQPVSIPSQIPDTLWLVDITSGTPVFTLVYEAQAGYELRTPLISSDTPNFVCCGERLRYGSGDEKVYYFDLLTQTKKIVTDDRSILTSGRFLQ